MRVCVTGATGLIGTRLVGRLLSDGATAQVTVQALVRPGARGDKFANEFSARGVQITSGDLNDAGAIARAVRGADVVFHLAAKVDSSGTRAEFIEANVTGSEHLYSACLAEGVGRVVHASSLAVYGRVGGAGAQGAARDNEHDGEQFIDETTPLDPSPERRDPYSHSKILADRLAASFAREKNLPVTIVRPGIVYGPGKPPPPGLLSFTVAKTHFVFAQPEWRIPLIYVDNLIDALIAAAQNPRAALEEFNIVDDDALTLAGYHSVRNALEPSRTIFLSHRPLLATATIFGGIAGSITLAAAGFTRYQLERSLEDRHYVTSKIRAALGWTPRVPLQDALRASLKTHA